MKVLVTGAGGMLGRAVVAGLHAAGHTVRAHDLKFVASAAEDMVAGDLRTSDGLDRLVAGVDAVVHTAAVPAPVRSDVFDNNVTSTLRLLEAAGPAGVARIVYVSSLSAVGLAWSSRAASPVSLPLAEDHPYVGDDPYGLSKQVGELMTATASNHWGIPAVSLRFPFIGTGDRLRHHLTHVGEDLSRDRGGLWAWIDTRDAVAAVAAALTRPLEGHTVLHVAAPDTTALLPTEKLLTRYHPHVTVTSPMLAHAVPVSTTRCREVLDFTPTHGWREYARW